MRSPPGVDALHDEELLAGTDAADPAGLTRERLETLRTQYGRVDSSLLGLERSDLGPA